MAHMVYLLRLWHCSTHIPLNACKADRKLAHRLGCKPKSGVWLGFRDLGVEEAVTNSNGYKSIPISDF